MIGTVDELNLLWEVSSFVSKPAKFRLHKNFRVRRSEVNICIECIRVN